MKLSITLILAILCSTSIALADTYTGTTGDCTYTLDTSDSTLVISGTGAMEDYSTWLYEPWYSYRSYVKTITIEDGVTSIGDYAFSCTKLTSVTIGSGVTSIGDYAFYKCSSITSITIPDAVTSIGSNAFCYCSKLTSVTVSEGNTAYTSVDGVLYTYDMTELICYPAGKTDTSFTIPDGVTSIGSRAFDNCTSLTSVTIGSGVTSIGSFAFDACTSLTSITIPDAVTSIGSHAFYSCSSLTSITIPDAVTSIGSHAFSYCSSLTSVTIGSGVTSIDSYAFYDCSSLTSINIPDGVTSIGSYAFYYCSSLTSITIPDGVTSIGNYTFYYCSSLTSITIPDGVTSIGSYAFYKCSSLKKIIIPENVTSIGDYAFYGCSKLTTVYSLNETPPTVYEYTFSSIYEQATLYAPELYQSRNYWKEFYTIYVNSGSCGDDLTWLYCDGTLTISGTGTMSNFYEDESPWYEDFSGSITTVVIGSEVTSIGTYAFYNLINLTSVYSYNETAPTARSTSFDSDTYKYATLYVTSDDYATADYWENFTKSETIEEEEEEEENNAITSVAASTSAIHAAGSAIIITTETTQTAQVYSLSGQLVTKRAVSAGETTIGMPTGGVYVVALADGTKAKVLVK